jgi:NADH-dependent peroxiredoxin subunit C
VHLAWHANEKELEKATFLMGSDVRGDVARQFGVLDEGSGLALRGTFLISPDGKLTNSEVNFYNLGRNIDELLRKLKANLYLAKKPTEACPAKWKDEGDKTLTPSAKMVGKVHEALNPETSAPAAKAPAQTAKKK